MKHKNLTILIQTDDDQIYQVALNKQQEDYVLALVTQMHLGKIRCLEEPLEGVKIT